MTRGMGHSLQPSAATVGRAWQVASRIVAMWPDLGVSWADWYDGPAHLIVGPKNGATLHFLSEAGPLLESASADVQLRWEEVEYLDRKNAFNRSEWAQHWGQFGDSELTAKSVVYAAIARLVQPDALSTWTARPARIVFDTEDPLADPHAVFRLLDAFPSLVPTVRWYATQVSVGMRRAGSGRELGWHEPLWQLAGNREPFAVLDEAGRVHLPRVASSDDNLADLLELVADDADWVAGGFSFDLLQALGRTDGSLWSLVSLIRPGARYAFGPRRAWSPADPDKPTPSARRISPQ